MSVALQKAASAVDASLQGAFRKVGHVVTAKPWLVIIITLVVAVGLGGGMGAAKTESNGENLWTPQDTEAKDQQKWVMDTFGAAKRGAYAYSMRKETNVLTREGLSALAKLVEKIKAISVSCEKGSCNGKEVHYGPGGGVDVSTGEAIMSVLSIWGDQAPPAGNDFLVELNNQDTWVSTSGTRLSVQDMLGGVEYDANGKIISAKVFRTKFTLKNDREDVENDDKDPATEAWEEEFDKTVLEFSDNALPENYPYSEAGQDSEGGRAIRGDVGSLSFGYMLMIVFSTIVLSHSKLSKSNSVISFFSVLSVAMASTSAFGICAYCGVKQNPVVSVLYLLLLGIGMDDTFVIMGALLRIEEGEPRDRVVKAVTRAGASITVTSVTNIVAFAAGMSSSLPALRDFCIFAAMGIIFDFLYQCTFLVAIIYYRVRAGGPDCLFCLQGDSERTGCCSCGLPVFSREGRHVCCPCTYQSEGRTKTVMQTLLNRVTSFTLTPLGNGVVLALTLGMITGACTGLPLLKVDFDYKWFLPADSYSVTTNSIVDKYFSTSGGVPFYVYTKGGGYSASHKDGSLSLMYDRVRNCKWTARQVFNWYDSFVEDTSRSDRAKVDEAAFALELNGFVSSPAGARFAQDIAFAKANGNVVGITGTRAFYQGKSTANGGEDIEFVKDLRESTGKNPLEAFPFFYAFLYFDGYALMLEETIRNVIIALVCVFMVTTLLLGDILASFLVVSMVGVVDICLLGYMAHWNLDFNSVTAINVTIAVGLAVDYSAHVAHSFLVATGDRKERTLEAIDHIGSSVANGAFSTFLAVVPLGSSNSYVFKVFFKMWFLIIIFGAYMGLILLPVVLSWVGPPSYSTTDFLERSIDGTVIGVKHDSLAHTGTTSDKPKKDSIDTE